MATRCGATIGMAGSVTLASLRYTTARKASATEGDCLWAGGCVIGYRDRAREGAGCTGRERDVDGATCPRREARTAAIVALAKVRTGSNASNAECRCAVIA